MSHHVKKKTTDSVELNLAAMLDMAFQLLAFFTITFRPAPAEVEIQMRMPTASTSFCGSRPLSGGEDEGLCGPRGHQTLVVAVLKRSEENKPLAVGSEPISRPLHSAEYLIEHQGRGPQSPYADLPGLQKQLQELLGDPGSGFEQVVISADPALQYCKVLEVVEMCSRIRTPEGKLLSKVSLVASNNTRPTVR